MESTGEALCFCKYWHSACLTEGGCLATLMRDGSGHECRSISPDVALHRGSCLAVIRSSASLEMPKKAVQVIYAPLMRTLVFSLIAVRQCMKTQL